MDSFTHHKRWKWRLKWNGNVWIILTRRLLDNINITSSYIFILYSTSFFSIHRLISIFCLLILLISSLNATLLSIHREIIFLLISPYYSSPQLYAFLVWWFASNAIHHYWNITFLLRVCSALRLASASRLMR